MEKESSTELHVNVIERMMVAPCLPSPRTILQLSPVDNLIRGFGSILLVYNASHSVSADPAKVIREALSKVLVYYSPFAGRLRNKENGEREVDCTGEGALFVEAMADNDLSVLDDLDDYNPSFQQLLFSPPPDTDMEDLHPLVLQITQFRCGGFVLGVSLYQSLCDGKGLGQFLNGIAEMARGEIKPSIKPIWNRELVEAEDCMHLQFHHHEFINPPQLVEKIVQTSLVINFEKINCIKRCLMEECKEYLSTFEIVAAMVWLARSKAFRIPHSENVKLLSAMDMRRSFNPPLPKGYYGNVVGTACAMHNVAELLSGSLLHVAMIIKKSKLSLNENFRSRIAINPSELVENMKYENVFLLSDWRRLGYYEVDFGWGDAVNVSPVQVQWERGFSLPDLFAFLRPAKNMRDGIKIVMSMPSSKVELFRIEMKDMIRKYVTQVCHSKL